MISGHPLDALAAIVLANVARGHLRVVFEEDQILALYRLAHESPLERQCVHRKKVVAHNPRLVDVSRGGNQIGGKDSRTATGLQHHDLMMHRVATGAYDADARHDD